MLAEGLLPGDRMPNFMRHDADDRPMVFYDIYCGEPVVLVLLLDPERAAQAVAALNELKAPAPLVMVARDPAGAQQLQGALGIRCRVLADDGQIIRFLLGGRPADAPLVTFAIDANAHVRSRWDGWPGTDVVVAALDEPDPGRIITRAAPVLMVPQVFEPAFCRHLIEVYQEDNEPSGILRQVEGRLVYEADAQAKIRREHRIGEGALRHAVEQRLMRRVLPEIEWAYNYKITNYEAFKIVCYDAAEGGYFRPHRDNNGPDTAHRRFALTLNLNSDEYQGGELRFPEYGPDRYKPPTGGAVVFSCSLAHEALPVSRGTRYALVSFLYGADTRVHEVQPENRVRS